MCCISSACIPHTTYLLIAIESLMLVPSILCSINSRNSYSVEIKGHSSSLHIPSPPHLVVKVSVIKYFLVIVLQVGIWAGYSGVLFATGHTLLNIRGFAQHFKTASLQLSPFDQSILVF